MTTAMVVVVVTGFGLWVLWMIRVIRHRSMLTDLRKRGEIPAITVEFQIAALRGDYDHIEPIRRYRRTTNRVVNLGIVIVCMAALLIALLRLLGFAG